MICISSGIECSKGGSLKGCSSCQEPATLWAPPWLHRETCPLWSLWVAGRLPSPRWASPGMQGAAAPCLELLLSSFLGACRAVSLTFLTPPCYGGRLLLCSSFFPWISSPRAHPTSLMAQPWQQQVPFWTSFVEVQEMFRYCTKENGLVGKYWGYWTGWSWRSFPTLVILWPYDSMIWGWFGTAMGQCCALLTEATLAAALPWKSSKAIIFSKLYNLQESSSRKLFHYLSFWKSLQPKKMIYVYVYIDMLLLWVV